MHMDRWVHAIVFNLSFKQLDCGHIIHIVRLFTYVVGLNTDFVRRAITEYYVYSFRDYPSTASFEHLQTCRSGGTRRHRTNE